MNAEFRALRKAAGAATPGPYKIVVDEYPHYLGGKHVERRIFTRRNHPQLKGAYPVVNGSVGLGATKDGPSQHMVRMSDEDAEYLAAASPERILALMAALDFAVSKLDQAGKRREVRRIRGILDRAVDEVLR